VSAPTGAGWSPSQPDHHCELFEECTFDQFWFSRTLFRGSARDGRAIGIEPLIGLVLTGADAHHHQRSLTRIAELIVAARRQHHGVILGRVNTVLPSRSVLNCAVPPTLRNMIFFGMRVQRIFTDARGVTVNSERHQIGFGEHEPRMAFAHQLSF